MENSKAVTLPQTTPPQNWFLRIMGGAIWRQKSRAIICPSEPRLDGKVAVVTGGNGGVGYQTCLGLMRRGAEVIMISRSARRAEQACQSLKNELGGHGEVSFITMDLGDLQSVHNGTKDLDPILAGRGIDLLIANAGMVAKSYSISPQGHEITFATNVLGHHLLIRKTQPQLAPNARIIILSGDIYCRAQACTPDYQYLNRKGCMFAYCRSKLGNLWQTQQLQYLHPEVTVLAVHPGVVNSNFGANPTDKSDTEVPKPSRMRISCELGAQTTLWCATAADVVPGGYYHNTYGLMKLPTTDPASNTAAAREMWNTCEELCKKWL